MISTRRSIMGQLGEALAADYLRMRGYLIVERNFRTADGEIDIICRDKDALVFVEVRTRFSDEFGTPLESIDTAKQQKIRRMACNYLSQTAARSKEIRFDVVGILLKEGEEPVFELVPNAF